jgi:hypothetical protein
MFNIKKKTNMKKTYIKPETKTYTIDCKAQLMTSSPQLGGSYTGGTVLSPEMELDDEM